MQPLIFAADDDQALTRMVRYVFEAEGITVRTFGSAAELLSQKTRPDLLLLDRELPDKDGLELCHEIRRSAAWAGVPVIFVTGKDSERDRLEGLQVADDYVAKPFSCPELVARVRAVLRRSSRNRLPQRFHIAQLHIDEESMTVRVQGRQVGLTAVEFRLLCFLAANLGKSFRRDQLLDAVWGDGRFVTPRTVDVHVRRLRAKIETTPDSPRYIQTVRGKGYGLMLPYTWNPEPRISAPCAMAPPASFSSSPAQ